MRAALLLAVVLGLFGCGEKRHVREWRPEDHDQPEDEGQVEGGNQAQQQPQGQAEDPEQEAPAPTKVASEGEVEDGDADAETLWRQQCQRCHGRDGSGRTSMAQRIPVADLRESQLDEDQIVRIVTRGRREMPSFAEDLTEAQIRALAKKVITFRGGGGE